jgi:putative chitinase
MSFEFKEEHLAAMIPTNKNVSSWYKAMMEIFPKYEINTPNRIVGFVAQCAHESANFTALEENLNYKEATLLKIFPRYFGAGKRNAAEYAGKPEKIANYVYMDEFRTSKMGNVKEGDGWLFRGRGLKQLTGRENYTNFGKSVGMTAEEAAVYVATEKGAIESACWFWNAKKLNAIADSGDIVKMTKVINGGDIGLADRKARWEKGLAVLGGKVSVTPTPANLKITNTTSQSASSSDLDLTEALNIGSRGETVKALQAKLGLSPADGVFGPNTKRAVKEYQAKNGLVADGVAGPKTLAKLLG